MVVLALTQKANTTNLRIALQSLSIPDSNLRMIEPQSQSSSFTANLKAPIAGGKSPRSRPRRLSTTATIPTVGIRCAADEPHL